MKKLLIYFSLFIIHSSLCLAQDTLVLNNGQKRVVKVISVVDKIEYSIPPDDRRISIGLSKVKYIKYKDGSVYTIKNNRDTAKLECKPYIVFSGGASLPTFQGYSGNTYSDGNPNVSEYGYSGYANNGTVFSIAGGLLEYKGFQLTGQFSYIRNGFDAAGFMNETAFLFIDNVIVPNGPAPYYSNNTTPVTNVTQTGTYYYTNYSFLLGVTKCWGDKIGVLGVSAMLGDFIFYAPALKGIANYATLNSSGNTMNTEYYFTMNSQTQSNPVLQLGVYQDVKITQHLFFRGELEFQLTDVGKSGDFQLVDMNNGSIYYSGYYGNSPYYSTDFNLDLFNATIGIGYKF